MCNVKSKLLVFLLVLVSCVFLQGGEYEDWLKKQNKEYKSYKSSMDESFIKMLKQNNENWQKFKTSYKPSAIKNKPKKLPIAPKKYVKKEIISPQAQNLPKIKEISPIYKATPIINKPLIVKKTQNNEKSMNINFFYNDISIIYEKKFQISNHQANKNGIGEFFSKMSEQNFNILKNSILQNKKQLKLNDWGLYLLIDKIAKGFNLNKNNQALFSWYVLLKLNYDVKVAYTNNNEIFLLASFEQALYQVSFYELEKKSYYILDISGYFAKSPSIITYKKQYKNNLVSLDMKVRQIITTNKKYDIAKKLSFKHQNKQYNINVFYNKGLVDYYDTFAQSDYDIYLNSKMPDKTLNAFYKELKPLLKDKSELWSVNFLLSLVQKSFAYKTDNAQFGKEKIFFSSASLYYPYSDCEDRSIIFSRLVKDLLNLDIVAIKYNNHLSTGVALKNTNNIKSTDSSVVYKNKKYIIADPTYVNARAGMIMPNHKNAKFDIIEQN